MPWPKEEHYVPADKDTFLDCFFGLFLPGIVFACALILQNMVVDTSEVNRPPGCSSFTVSPSAIWS